jgi:deoxyribodipyrimidine photolyase
MGCGGGGFGHLRCSKAGTKRLTADSRVRHTASRGRAQFLLESVAALKGSLKALGSDLLVAVGRPEDVIPGGWPTN